MPARSENSIEGAGEPASVEIFLPYKPSRLDAVIGGEPEHMPGATRLVRKLKLIMEDSDLQRALGRYVERYVRLNLIIDGNEIPDTDKQTILDTITTTRRFRFTPEYLAAMDALTAADAQRASEVEWDEEKHRAKDGREDLPESDPDTE